MKTTFAEIMLEQQQSEKPITKNMIKEALTEGKREQQKVDERKKNIMVFNAPESAADNDDQCHKEDIELFYDICNEIDDSILINSETNRKNKQNLLLCQRKSSQMRFQIAVCRSVKKHSTEQIRKRAEKNRI